MMKKILALLLTVMMLFVASCGKKEEEPKQEDKKFTFTYNGVELVIGEEFDQTLLPEPLSRFEMDNCALDGKSVEYDYGDFTLTTNIEDDKEILDVVYFVDPNLTTAEGLGLGDDAEKVKELYGVEPKEGEEVILKRGGTFLSIYVMDGVVDSIYYGIV